MFIIKMELFDIEEQEENSILYDVFVTRLDEYKNSAFNDSQFDNIKDTINQENDQNRVHIVSAVIVSTSTMLTGILAMGVFKIGVVYTLIVCIFVLSVLIFGYTTFVQPIANSLLYS